MARQYALHGARGDTHALCRIKQGQRKRLSYYLVTMPVFKLWLSASDRIEQITTLVHTIVELGEPFEGNMLGAGALLVAETAGEKGDHSAHHVADNRREDGIRHESQGEHQWCVKLGVIWLSSRIATSKTFGALALWH